MHWYDLETLATASQPRLLHIYPGHYCNCQNHHVCIHCSQETFLVLTEPTKCSTMHLSSSSWLQEDSWLVSWGLLHMTSSPSSYHILCWQCGLPRIWTVPSCWQKLMPISRKNVWCIQSSSDAFPIVSACLCLKTVFLVLVHWYTGILVCPVQQCPLCEVWRHQLTIPEKDFTSLQKCQ